MSRAQQAALWSGAAALVVAAHLAALDWLAQRAIGAPLPPLPDAIQVDLIAPPPVTPAEETASAPPEPAPTDPPTAPPSEPQPEPPSEPTPRLDLPPLTPLPPPMLSPPASKPVTAPKPPRPKEQPPPRKVEKPAARSSKPAVPTKPVQDRAPKAGEATGAAAKAKPGAAQRTASPGAMATWQDKVSGKIAAHMARTRASGRGKAVPVTLAVTIDAKGQVRARLAGSTGDAGLDAAISRQTARIPKMPPPPDGRTFSFTRTIRVQFR